MRSGQSGEREGVPEFADDIAGCVVLAGKESGTIILYNIRKSDQCVKVNEKGTHREDGTSGAIDDGTSKLRGAPPHNLGEVRGGGVTGVITCGFICPLFE